MEDQPKRPAHRPTTWTQDKVEQLAIKLIDYFNKPAYTEEIQTKISHKGNEYQEQVRKPIDLPTIENFCCENNISTVHFYELVKGNDQLSNSLSYARNKQKHFLITNGLNKGYDSRFASLVAINLTDMRNTVHTESQQTDKLLAIIEKSVNLLAANRQPKALEANKLKDCKPIDIKSDNDA